MQRSFSAQWWDAAVTQRPMVMPRAPCDRPLVMQRSFNGTQIYMHASTMACASSDSRPPHGQPFFNLASTLTMLWWAVDYGG